MNDDFMTLLAVVVVGAIIYLIRAMAKTERAREFNDRYGIVSNYVLDALFRVALNNPHKEKEYEDKAKLYNIDARVLYIMDSIEVPLKNMGIKVELEEVYNIAMRHLVERSEFPERINKD